MTWLFFIALHYQFGETSVFAAVIEDISVENVAEKMCEKDAGNVHPKEKLYSYKVPGFGKAIFSAIVTIDFESCLSTRRDTRHNLQF